MIKIENLSKKIGNFKMKNINLEIEKGDYYVILGPSGTGKTMLLEIIAGLKKIDTGKLYFEEKLVNSIKPESRNVGMVYQDYMLFPNMNVEKNILFGVKNKNSSDYKDKFSSLIKKLEIEHLIKRDTKNLSGGERQRVALARTLITEPNVLLLDEPLSALDYNTKDKVQDKLIEIHHEYNMTTLHVTHDFNEAIYLADKIAIIKDGEIVQKGNVEEIFQKPKNSFVAGFVGCKNIFKGKVIQKNYIKITDTVFIDAIVSEKKEISIMIRSDNIIVSLEKINSSAKNSFKGKIIKINRKLNVIEVTVDIGVEIVAYITYSSFQKMKLDMEKEVFITFKASAVHVY